jgi:hypothetical protein
MVEVDLEMAFHEELRFELRSSIVSQTGSFFWFYSLNGYLKVLFDISMRQSARQTLFS